MYQALYRKWRPRTFDEICGQEHITPILRRQCAENRVSHAYLFCGTRGTGKTSMAKILAKAVNCEHPVNGNPCNECFACKAIDSGAATDVLEIDAASNNGVDDIRDLRDEVIYPPSSLKKRVYIIDEVHMLSQGAFNALLKTLEEPPEYILFILATTELNKLPATVISRCVRFDFTRLPEQVIADRIRYVASQESIGIEDAAADLLARLADGAMRDGLSILEACTAGLGPDNTITVSAVEERVGLAGADMLTALLRAVFRTDTPEALSLIDQVHRSSKDLSLFLQDLSSIARDLLVMTEMKRTGARAGGYFRYRAEELALLGEFPDLLTPEYLIWMCGVLEESVGRMTRYGTDAKIRTDLMIIRLCDPQLSDRPAALVARMVAVERSIALLSSGTVPAAPASEVPADSPEPKRKAKEKNSAPVPEIVEKAAESAKAEKPEKTAAPQTDKTAGTEVPAGGAEAPFDKTAELLEELASHPNLTGFLASAVLSVRGNELIVRNDQFSVSVLKFGRNPDFLKAALVAVTGKSDWVLTFEPFEQKPARTLFDEIGTGDGNP